MQFTIHSSYNVSANSAVLFILPGGGGTLHELGLLVDRAPKPAWYIACDIGHKGKHQGKNAQGFIRKLPNCVVALLRFVKSWAVSDASRTGVMRKTFVLGFSRGAAWGCQLMAE